MIQNIESYYEKNRSRMFNEWAELLRFQSVSTDPEFNTACADCADWLVEHLKSLGFQAKIIITSGKPLVFAERAGKQGKPVVLYYGHYDVQPADPLEDWLSDPFEPEWRDGRLYARGAQDNKGQTFYFIKAIEALIAMDDLSCGIKILLEGEEESGSKGLAGSLPEIAEQLAADVLMVCDTSMVKEGVPTITMGLRGIISLEVVIKGSNRDLHSGGHGGLVKNPALELARLLTTLHDENGHIAVANYYQGVKEPSAGDREHILKSEFDEADYLDRIGAPPTGGEKAIHPLERVGFRPTIEINGLTSGYQGAGSKTIIPAEARAKLTSRLTGNQDPEFCLSKLIDHLNKHAPADISLSINEAKVHGPALLLSSDSKIIQQAREVLKELFEVEPVLNWGGGSIPIVSSLLRAINGDALIIGFGLDEDRIHSPNESFSERSFKEGFSYVYRMLQSLSGSKQ